MRQIDVGRNGAPDYFLTTEWGGRSERSARKLKDYRRSKDLAALGGGAHGERVIHRARRNAPRRWGLVDGLVARDV